MFYRLSFSKTSRINSGTTSLEQQIPSCHVSRAIFRCSAATPTWLSISTTMIMSHSETWSVTTQLPNTYLWQIKICEIPSTTSTFYTTISMFSTHVKWFHSSNRCKTLCSHRLHRLMAGATLVKVAPQVVSHVVSQAATWRSTSGYASMVPIPNQSACKSLLLLREQQ